MTNEPLHWLTDPLLFDHEPVAESKWLTANGLIRQQRTSEIFLWNNLLNLYPIMIRKIDFVRAERTLQTMPYILLSKQWSQKMRKRSLALAERCFYYFAGSSAECSIKQWQQKVIKYTEQQQRIPLPMFRLFDEWETFFSGKEFIAFQSARGETFQIPTTISGELAYLLGIIAGDGHLNEHNVVIVDFSKEQIESLQTLCFQLLGLLGTISGKEKTWLLHLNNKWMVRLVNFLTDQPIGGKKYDHLREPLLLKRKKKLRVAYWSGVFDADGSYKYAFSFSSAVKQFCQEFGLFLQENNINYRIKESWGEGAVSYSVDIPAAFRKRFAKLIQTKHPQKKQERQNLLETTIATSPAVGTWPNQIVGFQEEKILPNGFFDFSRLKGISVVGAGKKIKRLRKRRNYRQTNFPSIDQSLISKYELNKVPVPLRDLKQILKRVGHNDLMRFLAENSLEVFTATKAKVRLDLQPNEKLLKLLGGLQIKKKYFLLVGLPGITKERYREILADYFQLDLSQQPTSAPIYNSVLKKYVKEFGKIKLIT